MKDKNIPLKPPLQDCFIYVSQISRVGTSGQNKFEKGLIEALLKKGDDGQSFEIKIFTPSTEGEISDDERIVNIPLTKKNYTGHISHQFRLFFSLGSFLWSRRNTNSYMFIRYHEAMVVPLILTYLFKVPFSMRTGPILPNLSFYKKNPSLIVFYSIKWILGLFYKQASSIVTVTEKIKEWVIEAYNTNPEKIVVIPNAADTSLFFPTPPSRKKWGLPENEFLFGYVGSIFEGQGLGTIIQALGHLKKNQEKVPFLFIVGDGEYCSTLKSMSEELGVSDHIIWAGSIAHAHVRSAINSCNMMLLPIQKELLNLRGASALKLWEYLACDKPVLASEHEDHSFIENLNLGRMVEPDNIKLWAEALTDEAKNNNFHLQGRGEDFILKEHSYSMVAEKVISISFSLKPK
jgi:glycosyltransferase involved in cell wall biosynthesis